MIDGIPPGPSMPMPVQTAAMLLRQRPFLERCRRRYGTMFRLNMGSGFDRFVVVSDPDLIKRTFTAPADVLHAGTQSPLRRILGDNSLLAIDEDQHLEQRRLLLPPFKGQRMKAYESLIEEIAVEEIERWPAEGEMTMAEPMQRITLRSILRAVFGASGRELTELEELMPPWTELGSRLAQFPVLHRDLGGWSPWGRFLRMRARIDAILDRLIDAARADAQLDERADVLASLVQARHGDGTLMTHAEIRDQLVTMLAAGHETTAHTLSWAVERLQRNPAVLARLVEEVDAGGKAYRDATIREVQRTRPVIFFAGRYTRQPFELGDYRLPAGVLIASAAALTHFDPALFERPDAFEPERFYEKLPETYAWIPFGGGVRRCIGATFAHMEMDVVLRTLLERVELAPTTAPAEAWSFRGIAMAPAAGGRVVVRGRARRAAPEVAAAA